MSDRNKKIVNNSIFLLSRTIFLAIVTLYTLREVLSILGAEGFGLYSVVFGVVAMFTFINSAMISSSQRYLAFEIGRNNLNAIKNTFLSSVCIHVLLAFLLSAVIFAVKDLFLSRVLKIDQYQHEAEVVYCFALLSVFFSILQVPFSALITAYEKMQAFAYLALFEGIAKLVVVYLLYYFDFSKVIFYSALVTGISFIIFVLHIFYCYCSFSKILNILSAKISEIKPLFAGMLNFMGWSLIGNLAVTLRNHGSNILLNVFFGVVANAAFAIALTIMGALWSLVSSVSNAINPQIFKKYAENNLNEFFNLINYGTKYYMFMISLIILPLIFCMDCILALWLSDFPKEAIIFCRLALVLVICDAFACLMISGVQATGKIKWNQIVTGLLLCLTIPITYLFFKQGLPAVYIFYTLIVVSSAAFFTRMWFLIKLTQYRFSDYIKIVLIPVLGVQVVIYLSLWGGEYLLGKPKDFLSLIIFLVVTGIYNLFVLYVIGLNKNEKKKLQQIVKKRIEV